jgi:hypothetical protein
MKIGISVKLVRLLKMCLNETYSKFHIGKHLSDAFPIQNSLKKGDALLPLLFSFASEYAIRKDWNGTEHISFWSMLKLIILDENIKIP